VEGAAEVRDVDPREPAQHPVDQARRKRAAPRVVPRGPAPARDVRTPFDGCDEARNVLGRVLEVAVHRHENLAPGAGETGVHRGMLTEVPLEAHGPEALVARGQALDL